MPVLVMSDYPPGVKCGWRKSYLVTRISEGGSGKNVPRSERTLSDKKRYSCYHQQVCENCGKVLERMGFSDRKFDCPDYTPQE